LSSQELVEAAQRLSAQELDNLVSRLLSLRDQRTGPSQPRADDAVANGENGPTSRRATWTHEKNARRCALIDREIDSGLTSEHAKELEALQREMLQHRREVAPLPLEDARQLHQELLAKADGARTQ
jgi:hypothetical protein